MGLLRLTIFLGLATATIQKSVKFTDLEESESELDAILQNLMNQGLYKDVKLKINPNKKSKSDDLAKIQYVGEITSEKDGKEGLKSLNKKLAKLLDGLQDSVLNENTHDPTCSCSFASKRLPGVVKCQCGSLSEDDQPTHEKLRVKKDNPGKHRQKIRAVNDKQVRQIARLSKYDDNGGWSEDTRCGCKQVRSKFDDVDDLTLRCRCNSQRGLRGDKSDDRDGYSLDNNRCGCQLLRNTDGDKDITHYLKCGCNSARIGKDDDRDEGYWSDDNYCSCRLLRSTGNSDGTHNLRCRCNSPARIGNGNDRDGYWSDDNYCGCRLLRNKGNDDGMTHSLRCRCNSPTRIGNDNDRDGYWSDDNSCGCKLIRNNGDLKDLRCRCNSPFRAGHHTYSVPQSTDQFSEILSDLSDAENNYKIKDSKTSSDEHSLHELMSFILDKDANIEMSDLPKKDKGVLIQLNSMIYEKEYPLRKKVNNRARLSPKSKNLKKQSVIKTDTENSLTAKQIQNLWKVIQNQKTPGKYNKNTYRRNMPEDPIGVPFIYEVQGLAQINP